MLWLSWSPTDGRTGCERATAELVLVALAPAMMTAALIGFIVVHLVLVILAGPVGEIRSMVTGWLRPEPEQLSEATAAAE